MRIKIYSKLIVIIIGIIFLLLCSQFGYAYTVSNSMRPTGVTITMTMNTNPTNDYFTRFLCFYNMNNSKISVAIDFEPHPTLPHVYVGNEAPIGLVILKTMAEENMRSFWDKMFFENFGDSMALDIAEMEIEIEYANHAGRWYPNIIIGHETNKYLGAGNTSFSINSQSGRSKYVSDFFGWDQATFYTLPDPIRWFCYDMGKTASSDASDSSNPDNPKYDLGPAGAYICSETVSWYYYEEDVRVTDVWNSPGTVYDFKNIGTAKKMHDQFHYGDLRYDYDSNLNQWYRIDSNGNWDYNNSIIPAPGDYLVRMDGSTGAYEHAMMMLNWDPVNLEAYIVDGPYPVAIRKVSVDAQETSGADSFSIGRLPDNKSWITGRKTFTQTAGNHWEYIYFPGFINNPIVIMGPPTYESNQPCTMRVKDVRPRGFYFQLDEWKYMDGSHAAETVDYMVFDEGVQTIMGMQVEAGKVVTDENWVTVPINSNPSTTPVVLAQCVSYDGSDAVTVRIRNVTTTSFEVKLQEEEAQGNHCNEIIHYVVVEPGFYTYFDVRRVNNIDDSWTTINGLVGRGLSGPHMLANMQTYNGSDPAVIRKDHIIATDYRIKVEEETSHDSETTHADETVGILSYYYIPY